MIYHDSGMCTVLLEALGFIHVQPFLQQNLMALFGLTVFPISLTLNLLNLPITQTQSHFSWPPQS